MFPYLVAAGALVTILVTTRRWSRPAAAMAGGAPGIDPDMDARLDDELRNLD